LSPQRLGGSGRCACEAAWGGFGEPKETVMITTDTETRSTIARQNDCFRRHPGSDWLVTSSVQAKGPPDGFW